MTRHKVLMMIDVVLLCTVVHNTVIMTLLVTATSICQTYFVPTPIAVLSLSNLLYLTYNQ
jgi:hypothetical protein